MIAYYIDGSTKGNMIGAGIVKVNEFGFIEKHHFNVEHINPSSTIAEAYTLEKTLEIIKDVDSDNNELIDIYTDCKKLYGSLMYNENIEFNRGNFFVKQESDHYMQHIRKLYLELISRYSDSPIYHCNKTKQARPKIKVYFKDDVTDKRLLQEAHELSRSYIKEEVQQLSTKFKMELRALRKDNKWHILKDNKDVIAENKRPIVALSEALKQTDAQIKEIKLCSTLETIIKNTLKNNNKNRLSNESMKSALKTLEKHKQLINY